MTAAMTAAMTATVASAAVASATVRGESVSRHKRAAQHYSDGAGNSCFAKHVFISLSMAEMIFSLRTIWPPWLCGYLPAISPIPNTII
jgi:hypothetical protein